MLAEEVVEMYESRNWLGDENIEFFWEQIAKELNPINISSDILFVPPATVM